MHKDDVFENNILAFRQADIDDGSIVAKNVNFLVDVFLLKYEAGLYQWAFYLVNSLTQENCGVRLYQV